MKIIVFTIGILLIASSMSGASRTIYESKESREYHVRSSQPLSERLQLMATPAQATHVTALWAYASFDMSIAGKMLASQLEQKIQDALRQTGPARHESVIVGFYIMCENRIQGFKVRDINHPLESLPKIGSGELLMVGCVTGEEVTIFYYLGGDEAKAYLNNYREQSSSCLVNQENLIQSMRSHAEQSNDPYVLSDQERRTFATLPQSMRLVLSLRLAGSQNQQMASASSSSASSQSTSSIISQSSSFVISSAAQSASSVSSQSQSAAIQQQVVVAPALEDAGQRPDNGLLRISVTPLPAQQAQVDEGLRERNHRVAEVQNQVPVQQAQPQVQQQQDQVHVEQGPQNQQQNQGNINQPQQGGWGWKKKTALVLGAAVLVGSGAGVATLGVAGAKAAAIKAGCYLAPHLMRQLGWMAVRPWWYLGL